MNKETIKTKAKALRAFLANQGLALNHSASLEAIAHIEGEASYNVLLSKEQPPKAGGSRSQARTIPLWDVEVCRMGYAQTQVLVKGARTRKEAEEKALEMVDSDNFSEHSSDYVIVGKEAPEPVDEVDTYAEDIDLGPRDWDVTVCRTSYGTRTLEIEAPDRQLAEEVALDEAGGHEYSTSSSRYEVYGAFPRS